MSTCSDRGLQRGDMLLEALVGLLLVCILGGGMVYVATRVVGAQRDSRIEGLAVVSMRQLLREHGEALCEGPSSRPMKVGGDDLALDVEVDVACQASPVQVAVSAPGAGSITVPAPREVRLSLAPEALGLGDGGSPLVVGTHQ